MLFAIVTFPGFENQCAKEIRSIIGKEGKIHKSFVLVDCSLSEIYTFIYYTQSALEVLIYLSFSPEFPDMDLSLKKKTFRLSSRKIIEEKFGPISTKIMEKKGIKVNLKDPYYDISVKEIDDKYLFGIRLYKSMAKRSYRIYSVPGSMNAVVAFLMAYIFDGTLVDPFIKDGVIVIEKAISYHSSPRFDERDDIIEFSKRFGDVEIGDKEERDGKVIGITDNFNHLKRSKMNAKIAMVNKHIEFSTTKFYKEADVIVTSPPLLSKHTSKNTIKEIYEGLLEYERFVFYLNKKSVELLKELTDFDEIPINEDFSVVYSKV